MRRKRRRNSKRCRERRMMEKRKKKKALFTCPSSSKAMTTRAPPNFLIILAFLKKSSSPSFKLMLFTTHFPWLHLSPATTTSNLEESIHRGTWFSFEKKNGKGNLNETHIPSSAITPNSRNKNTPRLNLMDMKVFINH